MGALDGYSVSMRGSTAKAEDADNSIRVTKNMDLNMIKNRVERISAQHRNYLTTTRLASTLEVVDMRSLRTVQPPRLNLKKARGQLIHDLIGVVLKPPGLESLKPRLS